MATGKTNIPVEIFSEYIVEKLRRSNPHLQHASDESRYILGGSVVHIPQAGASPTVVKNRDTYPATAVRRGDTSVTYALDVYTSTPTHIAWDEENEASYDKIDSVMNDHVATLVEAVGDNAFYLWLKGLKKDANGALQADVIPSSNIIYTTGAEEAMAIADGVTATRKAFTAADLAKAQYLMNHANVPKEERYACLESAQYKQLIDSLSANQMAAFQQSADLANGVVGRLYGFDIMERSSVAAFSALGAPVEPGTTLTADNYIGAVCWQKDCVTKSLGDILPFLNERQATYFGDIFSALVKFGGRCKRSDWGGVVAILSDKPAASPAAGGSDDNGGAEGGSEGGES